MHLGERVRLLVEPGRAPVLLTDAVIADMALLDPEHHVVVMPACDYAHISRALAKGGVVPPVALAIPS